ncbi:MAG: signal recognition particle-docking protein FtsY [Oscillospiraceae bacterium]|jgi:fused signal recognition particle receptor
MSFFTKIREGLSRTKKSVGGAFGDMFGISFAPGDEFYDELEEVLIMTDLGAVRSAEAVDALRNRVREKKIKNGLQIREELRDILAEMLSVGESEIKLTTKPSVILMVGVNGVGKTTTIGKLACRYRKEGKKVLLCAGDTFRAAAAEQLNIWAERSGADIVAQAEGSDPASVVFDAIAAGRARGADVIICDTAGRLHNKRNLMNELGKINRIIRRELPDSDLETLLVIDATTGQNGLAQARQFSEAADITGLVLTKLDGTAKGGIVVAVAAEMNIPVKLIGVGEGIDDLMDFEPLGFAEALLES